MSRRWVLWLFPLAQFLLAVSLAFAQIPPIPADPSGVRGSPQLCINPGGTAWVPCSAANPLQISAAAPIGADVNITGVGGVPVVGALPVTIPTPLDVNVSEWGGVATTLGQKTMAGSVPVTLASDQPALPVTVSGGSVGITGLVETSPSDSTTDTQGWGKKFYTSNTGSAHNVAVIPINDRLVYAFDITFATKIPHTYVSDDGGQTWTLRDSTPAGASGILYSALWVPGGRFLLFTNVTFAGSVGLHASATGFQFVQLTLPGATGGADATKGGWYQGNTVIITMDPASGAKQTCRSTNGGASFATCTTHAGLAVFGSHAVASPTANVWIITDTGGTIRRSVDDGQTWATVATLGGTGGTVKCLSATVCLHAKSAVISRSVDAGATWATQITLPSAPTINAFLDYGSGLVLALGISSGGIAPIYRSTDYGVTWTFNSVAPANGGSPDYLSAVVREGRTYIGSSGTAGEVWYSPTAVAGQYTIIGPNGAPLFTSTNAGIVDTLSTGAAVRQSPTATPTAAAWSVSPVQGFALFNTSSTGAADTAVTATIAAAASTRAHVYSVSAFCSAGSATITITDNAVTKWPTPAGTVGTSLFAAAWPVAWTGATNSPVVVTLSTCGPGNTGTLSVQADRF